MTATATAGPTARPPQASRRPSSGSTRRATIRTTACRASPSISAGNVYFGLGENLGADYKLIGSDGIDAGRRRRRRQYLSLQCRRDEAGARRHRVLESVSRGFDAFGRLFAVDNDPDSRPPCRLLHIVEGGDYGYRFRNGRKGLHPFTAWNGELPGTLPMVAGTGEAPCGVLAYESDNLPDGISRQPARHLLGRPSDRAISTSSRGARRSARR